MSAPQIPNLLTLRGGPRSRGRGRGRGRGQPPEHINPEISPVPVVAEQGQLDSHVQSTDTDASGSRLSAVSIGYLVDQYAGAMMAGGGVVRRFPVINRGTYVRTSTIDNLVTSFIHSYPSGTPLQIISLGAGTDTRYFRLRDLNLHTNLLYHEIDFPAVSSTKLSLIRNSKALSPPGSGFFALHSPTLDPLHRHWGYFSNPERTCGYLMHPLDIRHLPPQGIEHVRTDIPTLLISECCLCYLQPAESDAVLRYFIQRIPTLGFVLYGASNPDTAFGVQMRANLALRGLDMPGVRAWPEVQAQMERLAKAGFEGGQRGGDMGWLWRNWVPQSEKERLAGLEGLDEEEEWDLLARHYVVVWAWTGGEQWQAWKRLVGGG